MTIEECVANKAFLTRDAKVYSVTGMAIFDAARFENGESLPRGNYSEIPKGSNRRWTRGRTRPRPYLKVAGFEYRCPECKALYQYFDGFKRVRETDLTEEQKTVARERGWVIA